MSAAFDSNRTWRFACTPAQLWERIIDVGEYPSWWPWLRRFDPGPGLVRGAEWRCEVAPPLPYVVRFTLHFDHVDAPFVAETTVGGDIRGRARLLLERTQDDGTTARLVSRLAPAHPMLRGFGRVACPLVERGHDWVLDQGRAQFVERGLDPSWGGASARATEPGEEPSPGG